MLQQLIQTLIASKNAAADDVLLEALRLGNESEQAIALGALLKRRTTHGLSGVVSLYEGLAPSIQASVLGSVGVFHHSLRECGRSSDETTALAAMKLIAQGRQGKLTYVLSEGLHGENPLVAKAAVDAIVSLSRWVVSETKRLGRSDAANAGGAVDDSRAKAGVHPAQASGPVVTTSADGRAVIMDDDRTPVYRQLIEQRPEIEAAVARALDVHRGKFGQELLRAALLLADNPLSRTFAILSTPKHGGQSPLVRRLQQAPDSEAVPAFLLAASHGGLRAHFGTVFAQVAEPPVLDALLRRSHWLKDQQLQLCMHQVGRGAWWTEADLEKDLARRDDADAALVGEWIAASGAHDVVQDEKLAQIRTHVGDNFAARLRLLRIALRRPGGASVHLLREFLSDSDERLIRLAARDIVRRRPSEFENMLIQLMTGAPESVRRVISRSVGQVGFEHFWNRFDRLDRATRRTAGRAMLKMLPDGVGRLERRLRSGPVEERLKAILMVAELGVADELSQTLLAVCADPNPKLRSKAVALLAEVKRLPVEVLLERALHDQDARVRANAIEVLESKNRTEYVPLLAQRARSASNRERANAIKALHRMKVSTASTSLVGMMQDERPEHRISALWALRQVGFWQLVTQVGKLAKADPHPRVRRYAMSVLRTVADLLEDRKRAAG